MNTKEHILNSVRELLNQRGIAASSTRDMAQAAGIRTLTYHFARKELIIEAPTMPLFRA